MNEELSQPTGLEWRFERELKAAIPGWKSEFTGLDAPEGSQASRMPPGKKRELPRHRPLRRRPGA